MPTSRGARPSVFFVEYEPEGAYTIALQRAGGVEDAIPLSDVVKRIAFHDFAPAKVFAKNCPLYAAVWTRENMMYHLLPGGLHEWEWNERCLWEPGGRNDGD